MSVKIRLIRANKTKFGGAENYLARLSVQFKTQGVSCKVVNSKIPKFLPSWLRASLFNLQVCLAKKNNLYFSLERITCADIYRAGDGVHKVFLQIIKKSKLNPLHLVYLYLEKRCFVNAKHIIANSEMIKRQIIQTYNIDNTKISVVYNGVNLNSLACTKDIKVEFSLSNEKILLYVGSGFKRKGVAEFLCIIAKLQTPDIKAFVIGKEKKMPFYRNLAKKLYIENKVIFTGPREDVNNFYELSDIFVFPTHYEPFSNVVLEAMNFHTAVFTTKQNGAHEVLSDAFIMQNPADDISLKIDNLLQNPHKLEQIQVQNNQIAQQFSIEKNAEQTLKIINEYIS